MIESGSEWFHRRTLAEVYVLDVEMIGLDPNKVYLVPEGERGPDGRMPERGRVYWREAGNFLRDYARNEPVTQEMLWSMGWLKCGEFQSYFVLKPGDRAWILDAFLWRRGPQSIAIRYDGVREGLSHQLMCADAITLRDLLQTLRVFGVSCPIPEAANV